MTFIAMGFVMGSPRVAMVFGNVPEHAAKGGGQARSESVASYRRSQWRVCVGIPTPGDGLRFCAHAVGARYISC